MPPPAGIVNVANVLTVVRIFLVPVFVVCLVHGGTGWRLAALAAFLGASATDFLDGQLARKRGLVTDFGKIADPIADKALTGAALITLSVLGELPGWVTGLILIRELGITALRFAVIRRGVIAASQGGKLKTLLQILAICLYLLPASFGLPAVVKEVAMAAALVVTLVTGADYVVRAVRMSKTPREVIPRGDAPPYPPAALPRDVGPGIAPATDGGVSRGGDPPYPPAALPRDVGPGIAPATDDRLGGEDPLMPARSEPDRKNRDRIWLALRRPKLRGD